MDSMADYGRNKRCRVPPGPHERMPARVMLQCGALCRGFAGSIWKLTQGRASITSPENWAPSVGRLPVVSPGPRQGEELMNTIKRSMLGAAAVMVAMGLATALAQTPPGFSPLDRTKPDASGQDSNLRPHPTPPLATAVDKLPLDKIKLPAGFKAE